MNTVILKGIVDKSYDRLGHKHTIPKMANFFKSSKFLSFVNIETRTEAKTKYVFVAFSENETKS